MLGRQTVEASPVMRKMNLQSKKSSNKAFISSSMIILLVGIVIVVLFKRHNDVNVTISLDLSLSTTPTPYSLPTKVYDTSSYLTRLLGQVFGTKNEFANPAEIIEHSQKEISGGQLDLYVLNDEVPVDTRWWQQEANLVYDYVSRRLETAIDEKVIVAFIPPITGNCAPRGTTFHEQKPIIVIFANQDTSKEQILAALAHELGHVFIHQKYENLSDVALTEGMATWAAGDYWKEWKGVDFDSGVKSFVNDETYLPIFQNYDMSKAYDDSSDCITHRDILLTELASFLDYLIQNYGLERLSVLFDIRQPELVNNQRVVYPPSYSDVYGLELNQLEYEWLKTLLQTSQ
jgi:hypothetical protein